MNENIFSLVNHEIYLVTTRYNETINGQIATWIIRATLTSTPLRFIFLISKNNYTYSLIKKSKIFTVQMLSKNQYDLVPIFGLNSGRTINKFENMEYGYTRHNLPVIKESCGWFECICLKEIDDGDRAIILADVVDSFLQPDKKPLRKFEMMKLVAPEIKEKLEQKTLNDGIRDAKIIKKFR